MNIYAIDLKTMKPLKKKYVMNTMFQLHFANCYEDESGNIVVDFPCYKNATMLHDMFIENLRVSTIEKFKVIKKMNFFGKVESTMEKFKVIKKMNFFGKVESTMEKFKVIKKKELFWKNGKHYAKV